jgi:multisubunit Na+/H+ antiporter MnhB subunit
MMLAFDILLAAALLGLGASAVLARDLFRAVLLFMIFGLLMSLAWARLEAPDIAITEAALGAGLTGALLLHALGIFRPAPQRAPSVIRPWFVLVSAISLFALASALVAALLMLPARMEGLREPVMANLAVSGVDHPLTAVLLNYRGYDTLLEIGVLLLAVAGVWSLDRQRSRRLRLIQPAHRHAVMRIGIGILLPLMIVTAGYMVWAGAFRPGGAFQAGALLGAASVMLMSSGMLATPLARPLSLRVALALGFTFFMFAGVLMQVINGQLLLYPVTLAGIIILAIESTLAFSIGASLAALFAAVAGLARQPGQTS